MTDIIESNEANDSEDSPEIDIQYALDRKYMADFFNNIKNFGLLKNSEYTILKPELDRYNLANERYSSTHYLLTEEQREDYAQIMIETVVVVEKYYVVAQEVIDKKPSVIRARKERSTKDLVFDNTKLEKALNKAKGEQ